MNRLALALLALCAVCAASDVIIPEMAAARGPVHEQAAYTRQDTASLEALIARPDDLLERGRRNATARAGRRYTRKEAAIQIARLWNIKVKP